MAHVVTFGSRRAPFLRQGREILATQQFEWTQPIGGQKIIWRPLKVGDHIDLDANYSASSTEHLKKYVKLASRIISIDGVEKAKLGGDLLNLREWDEYDLMTFNEEVDSREIARAVALSPQRASGAVVALETAVNKAQLALEEVAKALTVVVQTAKEVEQKTGPLK